MVAVSLVAVVLAGMVQRVSGIGFALVASPVLIVAVGPGEAVRLVIVTGIVSSGLGLLVTRGHVTPRQVMPPLVFAVAAVWPASLLAAALSPAVSSIVAGVVVLGGLLVAFRPSVLSSVPTWAQAVVAGGLSGAMNTIAALGGPMAATYGLAHRWGRALVPNMQLFLLVTSVAVLAMRGWPAETASWQVGLLAAGSGGGVAFGSMLSGVLSQHRAAVITVVVAVVGACAAVIRGAVAL